MKIFLLKICCALLLVFVFFLSCEGPKAKYDETAKFYEAVKKPFYHGVASGDPLSDRVIIWTRVTPEYGSEVSVKWKIASNKTMQNIINSGDYVARDIEDYTVKIDVKGLKPNTYYYYQFEALGGTSAIGRTKTASVGEVDHAQFAIVSCSNYEWGYFNALGRIADRNDLDAVLHLGDYIYEYGPGAYGDTTIGRINIPPYEIISLEDYRTRYALYRLDKDFQKAHQMHPFITIWDDHEIANNSYTKGAQNHQEKEGDYQKRKNAAKQAYYEWLPVRKGIRSTLYRRFGYGKLVDLIMLDERLAGRTAPADSTQQADFQNEDRTMLGNDQRDWFFEKLSESEATWKVIGNQVIFSDLDRSELFPNSPINLDAWDGYPFEKQKIINFLDEKNIPNVVFVSGDTHCSWAFEVPKSIENYKQDSTNLVAIEFGTTSINSANYDESESVDTVMMVEKIYQNPATNPHLKFVNLRDHGYLLLHLTPDEATASWQYVYTVKQATEKEKLGKTIKVKSGSYELLY